MAVSSTAPPDHIQLLVEMLSDAADGALAVDEKGTIAFWNPSASKILGFAAADVMARPCYDVLRGIGELGKAVCTPSCHLFALRLPAPGAHSMNVSVRTSSDTRIWISVTTLLVPRKRWNGGFVVHLFHSVQRQERLEEFARHVVSDTHEFLKAAVPDGPDASATGRVAESLTRREREVLRLLIRGESARSIADTLGINITTVRGHIQRILDKLGLHSRVQAAVNALQHGLDI